MTRRPIDVRIDAGGPPPDDDTPGEDPQRFKDALSRWASGVTVVAVRDPDDGRIYATTVSSLGSVSARPPRIVFSLGPGAQVVPFLKEGRRFAVNVLAAGQEALASRFTDAFPVGPSPFSDGDLPEIQGSHAVLDCIVDGIVNVESCRLVVGLVEEAQVGPDGTPLVYYDRTYRRLAD
jgi:flavin reductase (NADH)